MKFYSEKLDKLFDTKDECVRAEKIALDKEAAEVARKNQLKEQRAARAAEVEAAYKAKLEADRKHTELLRSFIKDYGSYHYTYKDADQGTDFFSLLDEVLNDLFIK